MFLADISRPSKTPIPGQTRIEEHATTTSANAETTKQIKQQAGGRKQNAYIQVFTHEDRTSARMHAAKVGTTVFKKV